MFLILMRIDIKLFFWSWLIRLLIKSSFHLIIFWLLLLFDNWTNTIVFKMFSYLQSVICLIGWRLLLVNEIRCTCFCSIFKQFYIVTQFIYRFAYSWRRIWLYYCQICVSIFNRMLHRVVILLLQHSLLQDIIVEMTGLDSWWRLKVQDRNF